MSTTDIFIESLRILMNNDNIQAGNHVTDFQQDFTNHVNTLNNILNNGNPVFQAQLNGQILPPVPIASTDNNQDTRYRFVLFSLNPGLVEAIIHQELAHALNGNDWGNYAQYYTNGCAQGGVYNDVLPDSNYYKYRIALMESINNCNYIPWSELTANLTGNDQKREFSINSLSNNKVIVFDTIPFHSTRTGTVDLGVLYQKLPTYKKYHDFLLSQTFNLMDKDSYFIVDGKAAANTFLNMIGGENALTNRVSYTFNHFNGNNSNNTALTIGCYSGKKVIILHNFLNQRGCFNGNVHGQLTSLINAICNFPHKC
jgi:hypothetical protein